MEEAAKAIEKVLKPILPVKPHNLALSPTQKYPCIQEGPDPSTHRLEEQRIRELQYSTLLPDPDRGVLLARAYYDIRDEPPNANANDATKRARADPSKPVTKLSLKDYKNKKKSPDSVSPAKTRLPPADSTAHAEKDAAQPRKSLGFSVSSDMDKPRVPKAGADYTRSDTSHRVSPSPEKKRRANEQDVDHRPVKRAKGDDTVPSPAPARPIKSEAPEKNDRIVSPEKKRAKEIRPPIGAATNGRPAPVKNEGRTSPRPEKLTNGTQKQPPAKDRATKKHETTSNSKSSSVPPLLSPLRLDSFDMPEDSKPSRPSPKKKPVESIARKPTKVPLDDDTPPKLKKRKVDIPPLLSPTLPPIIEDEMKRLGKPLPGSSPPSSSQKNNQIWDVPSDGAEKPVAAKKPAARASSQDSTIHVNTQPDNREEEPSSCIVTLKYKKRNGKWLQRLLKLTPKDKKKTEPPKREDKPNRERSESPEMPNTTTARKRPRTGTEANASEATKRPRASDILPPSTPLKQSSAMSRVASNSSLAGTPGNGSSSNLTPTASAAPERRRMDPEKMRKLSDRASRLRNVGRDLKHQRDALVPHPKSGVKPIITHQAMAFGIQSLLAFMLAYKLEGEMQSTADPWKGTMPWANVVRNDCGSSAAFSALIGRLIGLFLTFESRALCARPPDAETTKDLLLNSRQQQDAWQYSDKARRSIGVYDGRQGSSDGGQTGKLIDRLGPWCDPEDAVFVAIEFLKRNVDLKSGDRWKPHEELVKVSTPTTNGAS